MVELWDSVEPKAMAEVITSGGLTVTGVITAVDPALLLPYLGNGDDLATAGLAAAATDERTVADTFARQLEYAPVLAILDSDETDDEDRELLSQLHPTARQVPVGAADLKRSSSPQRARDGSTNPANPAPPRPPPTPQGRGELRAQPPPTRTPHTTPTTRPHTTVRPAPPHPHAASSPTPPSPVST